MTGEAPTLPPTPRSTVSTVNNLISLNPSLNHNKWRQALNLSNNRPKRRKLKDNKLPQVTPKQLNAIARNAAKLNKMIKGL